MNRKQRRAAKNNKQEQADISQTLGLFDKLPDECSACIKPYDKSSKEMALTWNVVVRDKDTVRLYCPDCWALAQSAIKEIKKEIEK